MNDISPIELAQWLKVALYVVGIIGGGICAALVAAVNIKELRAKKDDGVPQPMVVAFAEKFVPIERHEALEHEVRNGFKEVGDRLTKADLERRDSVSRCYKSTEQTVQKMRDEFQRGQTDLSQQIRENNEGMNQRINDILSALSKLAGAFEQSQRH